MLEGYDKEWSPVLKKTSSTFGNISEGTYTFKLKAQSPFGRAGRSTPRPRPRADSR